MDQLEWVDATDFDGKMVPMDIVNAVYNAAGIDQGWIEGNRHSGIPEEGWRILRDWATSEEVQLVAGQQQQEQP
jgi:hypothetical protein